MGYPDRFRCLAGFLAAGGLFIGFTGLSIDALRDPMNVGLFTIPNCVLSVAFVMRCVHVPRAAYRRALWRFSTIVHGIWLAISCTLAGVMAFTLEGTMEIGFLGAFWFAWLIIAAVLSIYALRNDQSRTAS
jgi:asparagine N-glycosylation enzyme membrane subunit Stt3